MLEPADHTRTLISPSLRCPAWALWAASDVGLKTDLWLLSGAVSAQAVLGFSFSPGPGHCRAGDPLPPLIRLGRGVLRVGSGSSLGCPSNFEESLTSFVPEVKFFSL